ncbi:MAG: putative Kef-type K+ transport protein [Paracoccaceae bacterium]
MSSLARLIRYCRIASASWAVTKRILFSSTVFTTKTFEEKGETIALHAAIAIGILIIHDLFAVRFIITRDETGTVLSFINFAAGALRGLNDYANRQSHRI